MFSAQIQAPIQRIYCMNKPGKLKKMALLVSSYSPDVYDGAIGEYLGIMTNCRCTRCAFTKAYLRIILIFCDIILSKVEVGLYPFAP